MPSILDKSEAEIAKYLRMTGQTREELEAELAMTANVSDPDFPQVLKGTDPTQKEKFTMPIGAEIISKK